MSGFLIALEGIDGSGTTSLAVELVDRLKKDGLDCVSTAEPSEGPIGELLRESLAGRFRPTPSALALLFAADRLDHLNRVIQPALDDGLIVITDRYLYSSLAYQSVAVDPSWVETINIKARPPDLFILLDAPIEVCLARIEARDGWLLDVFEKADFLAQVRENYLRLARSEQRAGRRVAIVSAEPPLDEVAEAVFGEVEALIEALR